MSQAPPINLDTKPKRSVSFLNHDAESKRASRLGRSSFQPGRRKGYVRKGPVQSDDDSEEDEEEEDDIEEDDEEQDQPIVSTGNHSAEYELASANVPVNATATATANVNYEEINRPISQTLMSKAAVRPGQNYVRKAPVNSDTESETDEEAEQVRTSPPSSQVTAAGAMPAVDGSDSESDKDKEAGELARLFAAHTRIAGPGQNYVRKAPVNSDTESDEEEAAATSKTSLSNPMQGKAPGAAALQGQGRPASAIVNQNLANASATALNASPAHSRAQSQEAGLLGVSSSASTASMVNGSRSHSPSMAAVATSSALGGGAPNLTFVPGVGMTMANSSATSLTNGSSASAQSHLASSMAIYQQQQQEMMLIMQQQQIQIATMQQQQQAYQLLVLQQQQQHQQQLQAVQLQHSRAASSNGSVLGKDLADDSDDDVPLGEKQQQLPVIPALPELPQFNSLMDTTTILSQSGTPPLQQPQPILAGAGPSAAHILRQSSPKLQDGRSRQTSVSSVHSVRSGSPVPMMTLPHLHALPLVSSPLNPATSSPLLQHQVLALQQQQQAHTFSEGDLQHPPQQLGPGSLLTSSFPAGYRHSMQSLSLGQLNPDRGSVTSLHSTGSNGSSGSGSGSKSTNTSSNNPGQRHSFMAQSPAQQLQLQQQLLQQQQLQQQQLQQQQLLLQQQQQQQYHHHHLLPHQHQTLIQSLTPSPTGSPLPFMGHHVPHAQPQHHHSTLIHVEAKPPPPQTGLVGAITAMERDKKLAKAQGTNQLQYQHQQQQHQMQMSAEKERWLQEQRRLAWESSAQIPSQLPQQQQQQQLLYPNMTLAQQQQLMQQVQPQPWTAEDEEDDDKPLGIH
ncbi:hypothetical protein EC968_007916 [Mortierella alpina]|nr:hypothetical protein EC968_007916 [Mortierella alpina]